MRCEMTSDLSPYNMVQAPPIHLSGGLQADCSDDQVEEEADKSD